MQRDFKGVWIPREIWLNKELTALDKFIYTEVDSLDMGDGCYASNKYLAEFCGCSERKVSDAVTKLKNLGLITVDDFDGRNRIIRVAKSSMQSSKICEADSQNLQSSNIVNKDIDTISINTNSSGLHNTFTFGAKQEKPKKDNLYQKCQALIADFTDDVILQEFLNKFLQICLTNSRESGIPFYTNTFKGKLNKLKTLSEDNYIQRDIVKQTLDNGWNAFYALKNKSNSAYNDVASEYGIVKSWKHSEEEIKKQEEWLKNAEREGKRVEF